MDLDRTDVAAMQIGHALNMLAELPPWTAADEIPVVVQVACIESYYVNLRLMLEFFIGEQGRRKDIHRANFLPKWQPSGPSVAELNREDLYGFASGIVVHLGEMRLAVGEPTTAPTTVAELRRLTGLVLDIAEAFVRALAAANSPVTSVFEGHVRSARYRADQRAG